MPIKKVSGKDSFKAWVNGRVEAMRMSVQIMMEDVGNQCTGIMRDYERNRYKDQTNNLRSSTGWVVVDGGQIVNTSGFKPEGRGTGGDGSKGSSEGSSYAESVSKNVHKDEVALVLVAGMNYAEFVEDRGLDVLASAKLFAKKEVKDYLDYLMKNQKK